MYILKKLNQEKKVMTAQQAADLEEKGWEIIQQVETKLEVDIDGVAEKVSSKIEENLKSQMEKLAEFPEPESEPEEVAPVQSEGGKKPEAESEPEEDNEPDTEVEPEKKTSTRSRKKG